MKLLFNYCLILAFIIGCTTLLVQSQSDRFEPSATARGGILRELREQVRHILHQNNREDLLSRLDDDIINEALDRVEDEALDRAVDGYDYDYHDQTQNAAMFIAENAHSLPNDELDDDAAENSNCNNNNNNGEDHDNDVNEEGEENNNQHHDNNLQNALNVDNDGECEEGY